MKTEFLKKISKLKQYKRNMLVCIFCALKLMVFGKQILENQITKYVINYLEKFRSD